MRLKRIIFGLAVAIGVGLVASGCILFMNDDADSYTATCHFSGESANACGMCVAQNCQGAVNRCCTDSSCRNNLSYLDSCVANPGPASTGCDFLEVYASSLWSCIGSACSSACGVNGVSGFDGGGTEGGPVGVTYCSTASDFCSCLIPGPNLPGISPNGTACSTTMGTPAPGDTVCCAEQGWPHSGKSCSCQPVSCMSSPSGGFSCTPSASYNYMPTATATTGVCCTFGTECNCDQTTACSTGETQVTQCDAKALNCGTNSVQVTSCSM
jgi:hypothetical protein